MEDKMLMAFKPEMRLQVAQSLFNTLTNLLKHFEGDHMIDPDLKNICIDAVVAILLAQKTPESTEAK